MASIFAKPRAEAAKRWYAEPAPLPVPILRQPFLPNPWRQDPNPYPPSLFGAPVPPDQHFLPYPGLGNDPGNRPDQEGDPHNWSKPSTTRQSGLLGAQFANLPATMDPATLLWLIANRKAHIADPNGAAMTSTDRRDMARILKHRRNAPLTDADRATTGQKLNTIGNMLITGGGIAAPLGVGTGAGVLKGLIQQLLGIHPKNMDLGTVGNLMGGPSFGEQGIDFLAKKLGGKSAMPAPAIPNIRPRPRPDLPADQPWPRPKPKPKQGATRIVS